MPLSIVDQPASCCKVRVALPANLLLFLLVTVLAVLPGPSVYAARLSSSCSAVNEANSVGRQRKPWEADVCPCYTGTAGPLLAPGYFGTTNSSGTFTCESVCASSADQATNSRPMHDTYFQVPALNLANSVCAVSTGASYVSGWMSRGGPPACSVVVNGTAASVTSEVSCLCLNSTQTQGLVRNTNGANCNSLCGQDLYGVSGIGLASDANAMNYACVPFTDIGRSDHFGFVQPTAADGAGSTCVTNENGVASTTTDFSCVCAFPVQAASGRKLHQHLAVSK